VRIWKTDEDLLHCSWKEVVAKVLHTVGPHHADVLVFARVKCLVGSDFLSSIIY
jgi:hypothetical protein